jgi:hypothetical protein
MTIILINIVLRYQDIVNTGVRVCCEPPKDFQVDLLESESYRLNLLFSTTCAEPNLS